MNPFYIPQNSPQGLIWSFLRTRFLNLLSLSLSPHSLNAFPHMHPKNNHCAAIPMSRKSCPAVEDSLRIWQVKTLRKKKGHQRASQKRWGAGSSHYSARGKASPTIVHLRDEEVSPSERSRRKEEKGDERRTRDPPSSKRINRHRPLQVVPNPARRSPRWDLTPYPIRRPNEKAHSSSREGEGDGVTDFTALPRFLAVPFDLGPRG